MVIDERLAARPGAELRAPQRDAARRSGPEAVAIVLLALCTLCAAAPPSSAQEISSPPLEPPRPISAAERAAVELALAASTGGAAALFDRLADDAPLRTLGREAAIAEIAVRLGPLDGATWTLDGLAPGSPSGRALFQLRFASGVEDLLLLDWVSVDGDWRLLDLRSGAEPIASAVSAAGVEASTVGDVAVPAVPLLLLGAVVALGCGLIVPRAARARWASTAIVVGALVATNCGDGEPSVGATVAEQRAEPLRLAALAPLRAALAGATDAAEIERELARVPDDADLRAVAGAWEAAHRLATGDLARVGTLVGALSVLPRQPLIELVRAHAAALRLDVAGSDAGFDRLAALGVDGDALRFDALEVHEIEGELAFQDPWIRLLVERATRVAPLWYRAASAAIRDNRPEEAEALFETGWKLEPIARAELMSDPALGALASRERIFALADFANPDGSAMLVAAGERALALPEGATAHLCGASLRIESRGLELLIANGAALAPAATPAESAEMRKRRSARRALDELPRLGALAAQPLATVGARDATLALEVARALGEERRWPEVVELTRGPLGRTDVAAGELARLRAQALFRSRRAAEARDLLVELARSERGGGRSRVATLYQLGTVLGELGEFEQAIRLLRTADAQLPIPFGEGPIRRLEASRELRAAARTMTSAHFSVTLPVSAPDPLAERMLELLELEYARQLAWIPTPGRRRIEVELVPVVDFFEAYGELGVLGLYDGRVRVPFADEISLDPEIVAITSHEVAHAMIDEATGGRVPRWFTEGLAQHLETHGTLVNPMPALAENGRRISVTALEPILDGFAADQFIELAYAESAWMVGYVEQKHGRNALRRLQERFASGVGVEAAIEGVLGVSIVELDRRFWEWGTREAPRYRTLEGPRYDLDLPADFALD